MSSFSPKTIHLYLTSNVSIYAKISPHALKIFNHLFHYTCRYFRRLASELVIIIPFTLIIFLLINLQLPKSFFENLKENVQLHPKNSYTHQQLAQEFFSQNQYSLAQSELLKASQLTPLLIHQATLNEEIKNLEVIKSQPQKIINQTIFWQKILSLHPSYRDGYLVLSLLNYELYRNFDVQKDFQIAVSLDPNNEDLKKFQEKIKN